MRHRTSSVRPHLHQWSYLTSFEWPSQFGLCWLLVQHNSLTAQLRSNAQSWFFELIELWKLDMPWKNCGNLSYQCCATNEQQHGQTLILEMYCAHRMQMGCCCGNTQPRNTHMHQTTLAMHTTALAITQNNKIERTPTSTNSTNHNKIATNFKLGDLIR